ncbi:MAG: ArsR/SmtB family transcription factor [Actinomycetes bacterium]
MAPASHEQHPTPAQLAAAVEVLRMLADPTRLELMWVLQGEEQDVSALTAQVAASRSSVSQHLGRLRLAGLVDVRRDGRRMIYRARGGHVRTLVREAVAASYIPGSSRGTTRT